MTQLLHDTFCDQAHFVQRQMQRGDSTRLGIREETLTDIVINAIASDHGDCVYTKKFTHKQENSLSGADWLWCVGEPGAWISFAVQAKIESRKTKGINYLHYGRGQQYNRLINFGRAFRIIPKYSLFSVVEENEKLGDPYLGEIDPFQWAFSVISPKHVRHLRTAAERKVSRVRPYSLPWSYVFHHHADSPRPLARSIAENLAKAYWPMENRHRAELGQQPVDCYRNTKWENPHPDRFVTPDISMLALYLLVSSDKRQLDPIPQVSLISTMPATAALELELQKVKAKLAWKRRERSFSRAMSFLDIGGTRYLTYNDRN